MQLSILPVAYASVALAGLTLVAIGPRHPAPPPALTVSGTVAAMGQAGAAAAADPDTLPDDEAGRTVRLGRDLLRRTYALIGPDVADPALRYAGNNLACSSCHLDAGSMHGNGLSLIGIAAGFPRYDARTGRPATIADRVQECMTRSMNGKALPEDSQQLRAMVAYLQFLAAGSPPVVKPKPIPELTRAADPVRGKAVYQQMCLACHGADGQGQRMDRLGEARGYQFPPLWGPDSFNDGAGMNRLITTANFVHDNMPAGATAQDPVLSVEQAWDVAAFVVSQPRPQKSGLEADYPIRSQKPVDTPYGPYADGASEQQHKYGPFGPLQTKK
ncbi:MAG: c-type cytochrome [Acetobacteraceae bacterium]